MIVSPSILSCDFLNIQTEIQAFEDFPKTWIHLDIMDGHFVPNLTFGNPIVEKISTITNLPLDAHFMVTNPDFCLESFKNYRLHNFTFHYEATDRPVDLLKKVASIFPSAGLSIKPKTPASVLTQEIIQNAQLILVMSVEPGFGGQKFIPETYDKIKAIREMALKWNPQLMIQVDGGVSAENAGLLAKAGADNLVAGSYVFKVNSSQYRERVESLRL